MVLFKYNVTDKVVDNSSFTFHYGSIQITCYVMFYIFNFAFTFHYGSIQINKNTLFFACKKNLHSTMVLFKLKMVDLHPIWSCIFTFHYGSIQMSFNISN